ncbi:MAG: tartrate-resistant acid phosphatase type 5 family protein [Spirosomataceae bacterium]
MKKFALLALISIAVVSLSAFISLNDDDEKLHFLVIGDWGRNGEQFQQQVADQMNKTAIETEPEFVINVGDNFYCCGVASTQDPQWQNSFEKVYHYHSLQIDWYSILGNHDYHGNPQAQIDYSKISRRWRMPARYYTIRQQIDDNTAVRLVFLDTNPFVKKYVTHAEEYADVARQDTQKQLEWLKKVLATSKEQWKIVIGHHPVYSVGDHGNTKELVERLKPILEKYKVHAYFCGHDHDLQHLKPIGSEVDYFVSGAGSEVTPVKPNEFTKFATATAGFASVSLSKDSLRLQFIDGQGHIIYRTSRGK